MKRILSLSLVTAAVASAALAQAAPPPKGENTPTARKPEYWRDERLVKDVRFPPDPKKIRPEPLLLAQTDPEVDLSTPHALTVTRLIGGRVLPLEQVLKAMSDQTQAPLLAQGDWHRQWVAVPNAPGSARELMESMSRNFGGRWFKSKDGWVLARTEAEFRLTMLSEKERGDLIKESTRALLKALTAEQWQKLAAGERIGLRDLNGLAQRALLNQIRLFYYEPGRSLEAAPAEAALLGRGVSLLYSGSGREASLGWEMPGADGLSFVPSISFYTPDGQLEWGVPPPR